MESKTLKAFVDLVVFDQQVRDTQKAIADFEKNVITTKTHVRRLHQDLELKRDELLYAKKQLQSAELELKSVDMVLSEKKGHLEGADYKRLQAKKSDVDRMQNLQFEQERLVVELVNRIDNMTKGFEKHTADVQKQINELEEKIKTESDKIVAYSSELELKQIKREEYLRGIPQEWLDSYNDMKEKVPDPVVPLSSGSCSGCFSMLTPADLQLVKRNNLVPCKLCYRLIYLPS